MFHLTFLQMQLKHPNPLQQTDWKHYCKCRGLTHSVNIFLNVYLTVKCCDMKQIFTHTKGLLYKHIMDSGKQFLALVILKILEVYSLGGSSQQTRPSRKLLHLLSNKKTIFLEGNEQRYQEMHCTFCILLKRGSQSSTLPFADDGNTG